MELGRTISDMLHIQMQMKYGQRKWCKALGKEKKMILEKMVVFLKNKKCDLVLLHYGHPKKVPHTELV